MPKATGILEDGAGLSSWLLPTNPVCKSAVSAAVLGAACGCELFFSFQDVKWCPKTSPFPWERLYRMIKQGLAVRCSKDLLVCEAVGGPAEASPWLALILLLLAPLQVKSMSIQPEQRNCVVQGSRGVLCLLCSAAWGKTSMEKHLEVGFCLQVL